MKNAKIYGLVDPAGVIRNIGKTEQELCMRLCQHWSEARASEENNHRHNWLRTLDQRPGIVLIEEFEFQEQEEWEAREKYWIAIARDYGHRLTNSTDGGQGGGTRTGQKSSPEHCAAISAALTGEPKSPEHRKNLSETKKGVPPTPGQLLVLQANGRAAKGVKRSPEFGAAVSAATKGKTRTPEQCAAQSARQRGKPVPHLVHDQARENNGFYNKRHSQESIEKMRLAKLGKKHTPEQRAAKSAATTGEKNPFFNKKHTPEAIEKMRAARHNRKKKI